MSRPARRAKRPGILPPWWAFLLTFLFVGAIVAGIVLLISALGGRAPVASTSPRLVQLTADPTLLARSTQSAVVTASLPEGVQIVGTRAPQNRSLAMDGPTIPTPVYTPTPVPVTIGRTIIVVDVGAQQLNVRDRPGVRGTTVVFRAPESTFFVVTDGPEQADGLTWWRIQDPQNSARAGWAASNYLQALPPETE